MSIAYYSVLLIPYCILPMSCCLLPIIAYSLLSIYCPMGVSVMCVWSLFLIMGHNGQLYNFQNQPAPTSNPHKSYWLMKL